MFATLRTRHDSLLVERVGANATFSACSSCRSKKLKCTGEITGCRRCVLHQTRCEYPDAATRKKGGAEKSSTSERTVPLDFIPEPRRKKSRLEGVSEAIPASPDNTTGTCSTIIDPSNSHIWSLESFGNTTDDLAFSNTDLDALLEDPNTLHTTLGADAFFSESFQTTQYPDCESRRTEVAEVFFQHPQDGKTSSCPSPITPISMLRDQVDSPVRPSSARLEPGTATDTSRCCRCTSTAVELMETLTLDDFDQESSSISRILQGRKHALQTCVDLCNCHSCGMSSKFLMLMIHICEKAVQSYSKLAEGLGAQATASELSFGVYDVSSEEESLVSRTLGVFQLGKWNMLLSRLAERCRDLGLLKHMYMVLEVDKVVQKQVLRFRVSN
ncbi:hypothetical protein P171DRAFT_427514 [Karstenula rhodostoma CBS 690.94]|uniref:Zn(2)-C6 fungal-type domain-containing protein n=1 Tax=Karstenula rhodostoma CBS 690.94 TaxID=1392251 RepID=A0A9P4PTZ2_9PLEO|nr:hypothetical protein P171DRAFT_427514 [Karstenula rhodostoma CBS 690.94]